MWFVMKVSDRMKIFIIVSFICLVICVVTIFTTKLLYTFTVAKDEYDQMYIRYDNMYKNFMTNKYYKEMEQKLLDEKYNLNVLTYVKQEEIIKILHGNLSSCGINLIKFNFSEVLPLSLNNPIDGTSDTIEEAEENTLPEIVMMNVNIEFNCNYENILKLIDKLQNNNIDMSITNMRTTFYEEDIVFVVMDIAFYAVPENIIVD